MTVVVEYPVPGSGDRSGLRLDQESSRGGEVGCCTQCGATLGSSLRSSGRRRRFCSARCRQRAAVRRSAGLPENWPLTGSRGRASLNRIADLWPR